MNKKRRKSIFFLRQFYFIGLLIIISSCGEMPLRNIKDQLPANEDSFIFTDKNGELQVKTSVGFDKKNKIYTTKKTLGAQGRGKEGILEQSLSSSTLGFIKNKIAILRPRSSTYSVWFEGKKYSSELKINPRQKAIDVKMVSPESQWNGSKQIKFPNSKKIPCFFSQVIECARVAGFINKAIKEKTGEMNLVVLWEGYPYLNETLADFPIELFSNAQLEYDGVTKEGEQRFNLRVAGQSIFYILNEKNAMIKMFWVSQGISMVSKSVKKSSTPEEGGEIE